jgi:hypothetical protein
MPVNVGQTLEQFRAYLECLTAIQVAPRLRIDPRLRSHFGWSDVINVTLLEAARDLEHVRAMAAPDQERWLRTMLANNLVDRIRKVLSRRNAPNWGFRWRRRSRRRRAGPGTGCRRTNRRPARN